MLQPTANGPSCSTKTPSCQCSCVSVSGLRCIHCTKGNVLAKCLAVLVCGSAAALPGLGGGGDDVLRDSTGDRPTCSGLCLSLTPTRLSPDTAPCLSLVTSPSLQNDHNLLLAGVVRKRDEPQWDPALRACECRGAVGCCECAGHLCSSQPLL